MGHLKHACCYFVQLSMHGKKTTVGLIHHRQCSRGSAHLLGEHLPNVPAAEWSSAGIVKNMTMSQFAIAAASRGSLETSAQTCFAIDGVAGLIHAYDCEGTWCMHAANLCSSACIVKNLPLKMLSVAPSLLAWKVPQIIRCWQYKM